MKLIGRRSVRIFRKGRYGKTRRIRFTRELIQINISEYDRNRIKTKAFELYKSLNVGGNFITGLCSWENEQAALDILNGVIYSLA